MNAPSPVSPARSGPALPATPGVPGAADWGRILLLTTMWGSSFALMSVALKSLSPAVIVMLRMWIGALVLLMLAAILRSPLPRLLPRPDPAWRWLVGVGLIGNAIPFFLIPWAQQFTPSALSGVVIASAPLFIAVLAHFLAGERLTARRSFGLGVAFIGVAVLFIPSLLTADSAYHPPALIALLTCAILYGFTIIMARFNTHPHMIGSAAAICLIAALASTPLGLRDITAHGLTFTPSTALAMLALGAGPSALATVLYMTVARSAGPGFLSLTNYLVPIFSVGLGALLLDERLGANVFAALGLILLGLALAGRAGAKARQAPRSGQP